MLSSFDKIEKVEVSNLRNGEGVVYIQKVSQDQLPVNCKMYAQITIPMNSSIGFHCHQGDEEMIYVLNGRAILKLENESFTLEKGMINITKENESHSIINNNKEELVILAVITKA